MASFEQNFMLHGADYNYEQWLDSPDVLDRDFELMKAAHCNVMNVGIFSWAMLEPAEGEYEFAWLDGLMDRLAESVSAVDHPVARRKNNWRDAEEMYQRFRDREPFDSWQPAVLRDYCDYALLPPDEDGMRQLACNPINEASNYLNAPGEADILQMLPAITTPITLLRAPGGDSQEPNFSSSPTWTELAAALPRCRDVYLEQLNHFIPMQDPELVARAQALGAKGINLVGLCLELFAPKLQRPFPSP